MLARRRYGTHVSTYGRYAAVGAIVGGATIAIREALAAALPADTPVYYSASVLLAYAVGIVLSYYGHRRFTFGGRRLANVSVYSFSLFTLIGLLGLVIVTVLSVAIRYGLGADQILGRYGAGFAFALATLFASVLTYTLNSLYTFRTGHRERHSGEAISQKQRAPNVHHAVHATGGRTRRLAIEEVPSTWLAQLAWIAGGTILFFSLAFDGRLHQDEPSYLYIGTFLPFDAIVAGDFQPTGIEGHYLSRLLHVLLVHALTQVTGPGILALVWVISIYLVLLFASAWLSFLILAELMPEAPRLGRAVLLAAFTPVYLYLAFKTLPETPVLFFSALAALALLRSLRGRAALWLGVSGCALVAVAFFKNNMALLWISLVGALLIVPPVPLSRVRLVSHAVIAGGSALALSLVLLFLAEIELSQYLGVGGALLKRDDPFVVTLLNLGLEGGVFFIALPLAFLSRQRRRALFFGIWFVLASAPLFLVFDYVEFRYLATNLIALAGLIWLAAEALRPHLIDWWERRRVSLICFSGAAVLAVAGSNALALAVMMHEVRMDHLDEVVERLDRAYGRDYTILVPWALTDFHYLRFAYPDHEVYSVQSVFEHRSAAWWRQQQNRYYSKHVIRSVRELAALDTKLVYLGFEENFSVANLRTIVSYVPFLRLERQFQKAQFINHLALSWMWQDPNVIVTERFQRGHYQVYDVKLRTRSSGR